MTSYLSRRKTNATVTEWFKVRDSSSRGASLMSSNLICRNMFFEQMAEFTNSWFSGQKPTWETIFTKFDKQTFADALEVGTYEGQSALGILDMFPHAMLTCVDSWTGDGQGQFTEDYDAIFKRFKKNIFPVQSRVNVIRESSFEALPKLYTNGKRFDLIYIDGSHHSANVLFDAVVSFRLLRVGGILVFDDYIWQGYKEAHKLHFNPKLAIDAFLCAYFDHIEILFQGWQVFLRKIQDKD